VSDPLARDIAQLVEVFKAHGWRELRIETAAVSLLLSDDPTARPEAATAPERASSVPAESPTMPPVAAPASIASRDPIWVPIVAPNLGTFYRSPKPGSAPFVEVGDPVLPGTEICLLEVMKLFTSVTAGVSGVVREIVAQDAELVEGGQPLFYIEPQGN
jgi:acetyl-CoA carboxylase biotin carboxyl carrier protein